MSEKKTADYKIISTPDGNRYQFFCDLSAALICTTEPIGENSPEDELLRAWNVYAKEKFNRCSKCGRWVINEMFNPDVLNCVLCTPIEDYPEFCPNCGAKTSDPAFFCHMCGKKLLYGGDADEDKNSECDKE